MLTKLTFKPHEHRSTVWPYAYWDNEFTPDELNNIIKMGDEAGVAPATLFADDQDVTNYRKSQTNMHNVNDSNRWLFNRLAGIIEQANDQFFQYDLIGFDHFQYTVYNSGEYYHHHADISYFQTDITKHTHLTRKLSASLILSDPSEYQGGDFELCIGKPDAPIVTEQLKGRIILFPSFVLHRVTPITQGTRKSIVVWTLGPKFK